MAVGKKLRYETLWLSDIHLGYKDCKAELLIDFLQQVETKRIFLVGDIFDFWSLKKQLFWPPEHLEVLRLLIKKSETGVRVIYLPGNHDEVLRRFLELTVGRIEIYPNYVHRTAAGKRLYITHGDEFDAAVRCSGLIRILGECAYDLLMFVNRWLNRCRRSLGFPYWSLAALAKSRVGKARQAIALFRRAALHEARRQGLDGIVCGHIHHAELFEDEGILYCNDGDWVDSCTALAEHADGELEIINWLEEVRGRAAIKGTEAEVLASARAA